MDLRVADMLRRLNNDFYSCCALSFSETRQAPWEGWRACAPYLAEACRPVAAAGEGSGLGGDAVATERVDHDGRGDAAGGARAELRLLDLACGNGRFEAFLADALPGAEVRALALDSCDALLSEARAAGARFRRFDALEALIRDEPWDAALAQPPACAGASAFVPPAGFGPSVAARGGEAAQPPASASPAAPRPSAGPARFDAAVSFGFFHHIPSADLRERALRALVGAVRPGGIVVVSLWRFLEDERLVAKAARSHPDALAVLAPVARSQLGLDLASELEPGDRFLGWQGASGLWRYCHSFSEGEIDRLADAVADVAREVARFRSDGKSGRLNAYLIVRKH